MVWCARCGRPGSLRREHLTGLRHCSLRVSAVIVADNSDNRDSYREYFDCVESNGCPTMTLPFDGGLEFTVVARQLVWPFASLAMVPNEGFVAQIG